MLIVCFVSQKINCYFEEKKEGEADVRLVISPWSTDRWTCPRPEPLHTLARLFCFASLMCVCVCVCVCVQGVCLHCTISHASLLSLCAFESVYAWISGAGDPCSRHRLGPWSRARTPFISTCCHLTPSTANPTQQHGDQRDGAETTWQEREKKEEQQRQSRQERPSNGSNKENRKNKERRRRRAAEGAKLQNRAGRTKPERDSSENGFLPFSSC